jgi:hypothetical protein
MGGLFVPGGFDAEAQVGLSAFSLRLGFFVEYMI